MNRKIITPANRDRLMKEGFTKNQAVLLLALISYACGIDHDWEYLDKQLNRHRQEFSVMLCTTQRAKADE